MKILLAGLMVAFCLGGLSAEESHHRKESDHAHQEEKGEEEHGHGEEAESFDVGPDHAVTEASRENGFKLSEKAIQTLKVKAQALSSSAPYALPSQAIVHFKGKSGVYRLRAGWFKLIEGSEVKAGAQQSAFKPKKAEDFQKGDQIAIQGVPLLRAAELRVFSDSDEGHGH